MALQGSGSISFGQISAEFGLPPGKNLGAYRVSETYGSMVNIALDDGIPQSGQIRFSHFYNKRLNVVVNYFSGGEERRVLARNRYNNGPGNGKVNVVGGYRGKPGNSSGTRVIIHVNKRLGSEYDGSRGMKCALRTGNWESGTNLLVNVGGSGACIGAAGAGGKGGNRNSGPTNGQRGSSGLGVQYPIDLVNFGFLAGGGGGGGGGRGDKRDRTERRRSRRKLLWMRRNSRRKKYDRRRKGGGGGGGGQGFPAGAGGSGASDGGQNGTSGSRGAAGAGGQGGFDGAKDGANGGSFGNFGGNADGAGGGHPGRSIVISGSGSVNYVVQGTLYGPVVNHPVF